MCCGRLAEDNANAMQDVLIFFSSLLLLQVLRRQRQALELHIRKRYVRAFFDLGRKPISPIDNNITHDISECAPFSNRIPRVAILVSCYTVCGSEFLLCLPAPLFITLTFRDVKDLRAVNCQTFSRHRKWFWATRTEKNWSNFIFFFCSQLVERCIWWFNGRRESLFWTGLFHSLIGSCPNRITIKLNTS